MITTRTGLLAHLSTRAVPRLRRLIAIIVANVHDTRMRIVSAHVDQGRRIAIIGVDTNNSATLIGSGALDVDVALALALAL